MLHNPYSNHYHQIDNPPTPSNFDIPNGLVRGKQIFVSGVQQGDRFIIDFITRNNHIAFHFNPRISQGCIVRNSQIGNWGAEETSGPLQFGRGQRFEIVFLVEDDKYLVAINGQHAFEFRHRIPYQEVSKIGISGECVVHKIVFSGGASSNNNEQRPSVPFSIPVVNGPQPGRLIQIHGQVPPNASRFYINLQNGPGSLPPDMSFHFNPRYDSGSPYVVKNNCRHGAWGTEEREAACPINRGQNFEILILIDQAEFKVAVNGQHFTSFRHRNGLHDGNHLAIEGDVIIHSVRQF